MLVNKIKEKQSAMPPVQEISRIEVGDAASVANLMIASIEFDGLTKSARRRLKKKLVSQSALNAQNSPDTDDDEVIDELNSNEVSTKLYLHIK